MCMCSVKRNLPYSYAMQECKDYVHVHVAVLVYARYNFWHETFVHLGIYLHVPVCNVQCISIRALYHVYTVSL